jgi:hypothetical protein
VLGLGVMVRRRWKDPVPSAVHTQDPKTKVSPRLKATIGLTKTEAVEFVMRSSARTPTWRASCRCFRPATRGAPEVEECGLAEISNSKEETRGTQIRQVRATMCVIPYVLYAA